MFGPITAETDPEMSLKAHPSSLEDKKRFIFEIFSGEIVLHGLAFELLNIAHCFYYETVRDHRYPFNFTQLLKR